MRGLILICLAVSTVMAQVPTPCVSPPQWEARYFGYDESKNEVIRARVSYDSIYKRERVIDEFILGAQDDFYDTLYLHSQNIQYRYNFKTKTCEKGTNTRDWQDLGVPINGTSFGESYIGSSAVPNANILATIWGKEFTDPKGNKWNYLGVWSFQGCLPISATVSSKDLNMHYHSSYYDITPGISSPDVFIPRRECL